MFSSPDARKRLLESPGAYPALLINSVASALILLVCAASVGWLVTLSIADRRIAVVVGVLLAVLLLLAEFLFASMGGPHAHMHDDTIQTWRPHPIRLTFFFLIAACFSQSALLAVHTLRDPERIVSVVEAEKLRGKQHSEAVAATLTSELEGHLRQDNELRVRLEALAAPGSANQANILQALDGKPTRRKALLIGNQAYRAVPALNNPRKDTTDLAKALQSIGFQTTTLFDASTAQMQQSIQQFAETLAPGDISLVYFSGHGFQDRGINYLVPVDFKAGDLDSALGLNLLITKLNTRRLSANLLVIDACRSFLPGSGAQGGLASTEAGRNTYIALAAKPGQTALDGAKGSNGFFTAALLKQLALADTSTKVDEIFSGVVQEVGKRTNQTQEPWITHNLSGVTLVAPNSPRHEARKQSRNALEGILVAAKDEPDSCETRTRTMPAPQQLEFLRQCVAARVARQTDTLSILRKCGDEHTSLPASSDAQPLRGCIARIVATDQAAAAVEATAAAAAVQAAPQLPDLNTGELLAGEKKARFAPADFAHFLRGLWMLEGAPTFFYSLLLTIALFLPFAWRDLSLKMLRAYGMGRNIELRPRIQDGYRDLRASIETSPELTPYADKLLQSVSDANPERPKETEEDTGDSFWVQISEEATA